MKKIVSYILMICLFVTIGIFSKGNITQAKGIDNGLSIYEKNKEDALREEKIMKLFDKRQEVLFRKPVDIEKLNDIDIQLTTLGVDFLTPQEVAEQFPEAKAVREKALNGDTKSTLDTGEVSIATIAPPISNVNTWATYRFSNQYYNAKYYNVQKLIAQPISENSALWEEGARIVNYSINWKAGVTNLISSIAWTAAGSIASTPITVYDALSSVWSGLQPVSEIDPGNVYYQWETQTTAVFAYVRLEYQTDDYQLLSYIVTKCVTAVAYIVDPDSWRQNGTGTWVIYPELESGTRYLYHTPVSYNNSTSKAIYSYVGSSTVVNDSINSITISGPESQTIQNIYPCIPQFPEHCEW